MGGCYLLDGPRSNYQSTAGSSATSTVVARWYASRRRHGPLVRGPVVFTILESAPYFCPLDIAHPATASPVVHRRR